MHSNLKKRKRPISEKVGKAGKGAGCNPWVCTDGLVASASRKNEANKKQRQKNLCCPTQMRLNSTKPDRPFALSRFPPFFRGFTHFSGGFLRSDVCRRPIPHQTSPHDLRSDVSHVRSENGRVRRPISRKLEKQGTIRGDYGPTPVARGGS